MTPTVLIIDDDEFVLVAYRELLQDSGCTIIATADGPRGIEIYRERSPDVVILDLGLPTINGIEVLREIRKDDPEALVIIITGYISDHAAVEARNLGAYAVIDKATGMDGLPKLLKDAFERRSRSS